MPLCLTHGSIMELPATGCNNFSGNQVVQLSIPLLFNPATPVHWLHLQLLGRVQKTAAVTWK